MSYNVKCPHVSLKRKIIILFVKWKIQETINFKS
jgi:hypothetical protein